jgi:hypothetical protein
VHLVVKRHARDAARFEDTLSARARGLALPRWLPAALLALALGCGPKAPPIAANGALEPADAATSEESDAGVEEPSASAPDAGAELEPADTPEEVAQRWLEALRRASPSLLGEWSRYPFLLHDTGSEGTCGHGAAADAKQLTQLLSCMLANRALLEELRRSPDAAPSVLKAKDLPTWARRWRNEAPSEATLVLFEIAGHGNSSHFVLVVRDGGVSALWKETVFDSP